jgi:ectoine hydroxylase-related dioxygenase (phytanoyl-CoA dioxygenase family)
MSIVMKHGITECESKDIKLQSLERMGYCVLRQVVAPAKVQEIREKIYATYKVQCEEVGGGNNLRKINDHGQARALFAYDRVFIDDVLCNENVEPLLEEALDKNYTLYSQVGVISSPNPSNQLYSIAWHREVQYQHLTASRPIAIQSIFILDDFSEENGGTYILPGSHLFEKFPSDDFVIENQIQPALKAGDILIMNSMLYHRSGINHSKSDRLLITNTFTRPIMASQFQYTAMIDPGGLTEKERQILGFRWNHNLPLIQYRMNRINKL